MSKEFYDKYGKLVDCFSCNCIDPCSKSDSPLCSEGYVFFAKDKIADLEAKLAESEKDRLMWQEMYKSADRQNKNICETDIYPLQEENAELKQQLAEKEKERHEEWKTGKEWKWEWQKANQQLEQANQDKISFAVEQLEKAKELCKEKFNLWKNSEWEGYCYDNIDVSNVCFDILTNIEQQIKQLKEGK